MLNLLAKLFSFLFHPLLLPTYAYLFIYWTFPYLLAGIDQQEKLKLLAILLSNTFIFPVITIVLMKRLNFINSYQLRGREERIIPFIAISLFYFWTFMVIKSLNIGGIVTAIALGGSLSVFMAFFFTLFFKISIHSIGAGNFIVISLFLALTSTFNIEIPLMIIIILAGLVGSSRLYLKAHQPMEVYTGYLVGILGQVLAFKFI